jgi:hypothetical protein
MPHRGTASSVHGARNNAGASLPASSPPPPPRPRALITLRVNHPPQPPRPHAHRSALKRDDGSGSAAGGGAAGVPSVRDARRAAPLPSPLAAAGALAGASVCSATGPLAGEGAGAGAGAESSTFVAVGLGALSTAPGAASPPGAAAVTSDMATANRVARSLTESNFDSRTRLQQRRWRAVAVLWGNRAQNPRDVRSCATLQVGVCALRGGRSVLVMPVAMQPLARGVCSRRRPATKAGHLCLRLPRAHVRPGHSPRITQTPPLPSSPSQHIRARLLTARAGVWQAPGWACFSPPCSRRCGAARPPTASSSWVWTTRVREGEGEGGGGAGQREAERAQAECAACVHHCCFVPRCLRWLQSQ